MKRKIGFLLTLLLMVCLIGAVLTACPGVEPTPSGDKTYNVNYNRGDPNAEGDSVQQQKYKEGEEFTLLPDTTFTLAGHEFVAWNDGEKEVEAGSTYKMPARNVTFTAVWREEVDDSIKLIFDANGATGTGHATRQLLGEEGEMVTIPGKGDLVREGYTFLGWSDGYFYYEPGQSVPASQLITWLAEQERNVTLKARWSKDDNDTPFGHWLNGTVVSGPLHDREPIEVVRNGGWPDEYTVLAQLFVEEYISLIDMGDNKVRMAVGIVNRNADEAGTFKNAKKPMVYLYDLVKLSETEFVSENLAANGGHRAVYEDGSLKVWFNITTNGTDDPSYIEFDEYKPFISDGVITGVYHTDSLDGLTYVLSGMKFEGTDDMYIGTMQYDGGTQEAVVYQCFGDYIDITVYSSINGEAYINELYWLVEGDKLGTLLGNELTYQLYFDKTGDVN